MCLCYIFPKDYILSLCLSLWGQTYFAICKGPTEYAHRDTGALCPHSFPAVCPTLPKVCPVYAHSVSQCQVWGPCGATSGSPLGGMQQA